MERTKSSIQAEFGPIIAAYIANGGRVCKFCPRGNRIA